MKDRTTKNGLALLLAFGLLAISVQGRVFTTRPGGSAKLNNPSSFNAREIYGGRFRINGCLAEMKVLAGSASATDTVRMFHDRDGSVSKDLRYRASAGTVVGSMGQGVDEKRFMISSVGAQHSCLVFVLKSNEKLFGNPSAQVPWPQSLPELNAHQQTRLVVEHLDTQFVFACVSLPGRNVESILEDCQERLTAAGWNTEPLTDETLSGTADSGFAVLHKKGKTCWVEAKAGSTGNEVLVTLLCRTEE